MIYYFLPNDQSFNHSGQRGKRSYDRPLIFTKFFSMTPLLPVCVSLHVPVARIADMPPRIPMHATSK